MAASELTDLIRQAEHLLWVIARCDVEGLSMPRAGILRRLDVLERRALRLGVMDLYARVLRQEQRLIRIML